MLVGEGANSYAMQQGMELCSVNELITGMMSYQSDDMVILWCIDRAQAVYIDHMNRLERSNDPLAKKVRIDPVSPLLMTPVLCKADYRCARYSGCHCCGHKREFMCWGI